MVLALPKVIEDDGLIAFDRQRQTTVWRVTPELASLAAAILTHEQTGVPAQYLAPGAPPAERDRLVAAALERAVLDGRLPGVPLRPDAYYELFTATMGWGPAQVLIDDPATTELNIIGRGVELHQRGRGRVWLPDFMGDVDMVSRVHVLASRAGIALNEQSPQVDIPCGFGCRLSVVIAPLSRNGIYVGFRRGQAAVWTATDLVDRGMISPEVVQLVMALLNAGSSLFVGGSTGSGKTTVLKALMNSLAGQPKILSIEDNVLELHFASDRAWIREMVDSSADPRVYGRAVRGALRQSPHVIVLGEVRGAEAGAALAAARSGHMIASTIHGESAREVLEQCAMFASDREAYLFADRYEEAMIATCNSLDVIVMVEEWPDAGRRLITSVSLVAGCRLNPNTNRLAPVVVPLAEVAVGADGIGWDRYATLIDGTLIWDMDRLPASVRMAHPTIQTPYRLAQRLKRQAQRVQLSVNYERAEGVEIAETLRDGSAAVDRGDIPRAVSILQAGWHKRHDPALIPLATKILDHAPALADEMLQAFHTLWDACSLALTEARWADAEAAHRIIHANPLLVVCDPPAQGWPAIAQWLEAGLTTGREIDRMLADGPGLLEINQPQTVVDSLNSLDRGLVPPDRQLPLKQLRVAALRALVATNQASPHALAAVEAEIAVLMAAGEH